MINLIFTKNWLTKLKTNNNNIMIHQTFLEIRDEYNLSNCMIDLLFAQASLESGHFQSNIYVNTNNAFGMKQPKVRPTTSIGGFQTNTGEYAKYTSLKESIKDRLLWDNYNKIAPAKCGGDVERYLNEVQSKGYAEDPAYINKVLNLRGKLIPVDYSEDAKKSIFSSKLLWLLVAGGAVWFFIKKKIPFVDTLKEHIKGLLKGSKDIEED